MIPAVTSKGTVNDTTGWTVLYSVREEENQVGDRNGAQDAREIRWRSPW